MSQASTLRTSIGSHWIQQIQSPKNTSQTMEVYFIILNSLNGRIDDLSWQIVGAIEINETIKKKFYKAPNVDIDIEFFFSCALYNVNAIIM